MSVTESINQNVFKLIKKVLKSRLRSPLKCCFEIEGFINGSWLKLNTFGLKFIVLKLRILRTVFGFNLDLYLRPFKIYQ